MYCPECGNQNPDTAKFCMKCGYNYRQASNAETSSEYKSVSSSQPAYTSSLPNKPSDSPKPVGKKSNASAFAVLLLLIVGGVFIFIYVANINEHNLRTDSGRNFAAPISQPESRQPQTVNIVNEAFSLKAGQFVSYKFSIPNEIGSGTVTGSFTASGGSNDIYVLVTNETGLTNIKNGNQSKSYYNSGKVTTDDLNINLAPGTYYIVFSNSHSMLTPKAINADIKLTF